MARQSRGRSAPSRAPSRPTTAPARPNVMPSQQRSATTVAQPPAKQAAGGQSSGLFGQMASTAAGVAVGSTIGHALGGMFGGGSTQAAESQDVQDAAPNGHTMYQSNQAPSCDVDAKAFTKCLDENKGSDYQMSVCGWYLEQLKGCQAAASQY